MCHHQWESIGGNEALQCQKGLLLFLFVLSGMVHDSKLVGGTLIKGGY